MRCQVCQPLVVKLPGDAVGCGLFRGEEKARQASSKITAGTVVRAMTHALGKREREGRAVEGMPYLGCSLCIPGMFCLRFATSDGSGLHYVIAAKRGCKHTSSDQTPHPTQHLKNASQPSENIPVRPHASHPYPSHFFLQSDLTSSQGHPATALLSASRSIQLQAGLTLQPARLFCLMILYAHAAEKCGTTSEK